MLKGQGVSSTGTQPHSASYRLHIGRLGQAMGAGLPGGLRHIRRAPQEKGRQEKHCSITQGEGGTPTTELTANPTSPGEARTPESSWEPTQP